MGLDEGELRTAVEAVEDPRILHSLGDLGMVREVQTRRRGSSVVIAVPGRGYPESVELTSRVRTAASAAGAGDVDVEVLPMVEAELTSLHDRLRSLDAGASVPAEGAASAGRVNQFADKASPTRVIGISSGKGGVGKSSVTVNLAVSLARLGRRVGLLDADVYGFSVPRMLGVEQPPMTIGDLVIPPVAHGVRCVSMGMFVDEEQAVVWRGPMLHKALEQFLVDVHWGRPDLLVVDMPPGTGDVALSMASFLPRTELYVVTTPQPAAERVAQRSAAMARQLKLPVRGVIENMSWFTGDDGKRYELFGAGGGAHLASVLGVPLLAQIPFEPAVRTGGDEGAPAVLAAPESDAAGAFGALAEAILSAGPARVYRRELTVH
jgi:ATP-binding protein involved in chromosome partitioning